VMANDGIGIPEMRHAPGTWRRVHVSPAIARDYLSRSRGNRTLRRSMVDAIRRDIRAGMWTPGLGEPIMFDDKGRLANGHHRLTAISEEDRDVWVFVASGCPDWFLEKVDSGTQRSTLDVLQMVDQDQDAKHFRPIVSILWYIAMGSRKGVSPEAFRDVVRVVGRDTMEAVAVVNARRVRGPLRVALTMCHRPLVRAGTWDAVVGLLSSDELPPIATAAHALRAIHPIADRRVDDARHSVALGVSGIYKMRHGANVSCSALRTSRDADEWVAENGGITIKSLRRALGREVE
jgi:hypothetical protein